jgi:crossover junction endodeoxyribonuclease RusA
LKELVLPWPSKDLSPNARTHWAKKAKAAKQARYLAGVLAMGAQWQSWPIPDGRLNLWIDFYPPTRRLPDDDNMLARFKPYRDGIADALGIDDKRFVSHPQLMEEPRKGGEVRIRITAGP